MIVSLARITLAVRDVETSAARYGAFLGRPPSVLEPSRVHFQLANVELEIAGEADARIASHLATTGEGIWAIAFAVSNVEEAARKLARRSITAKPSDLPPGIALDTSVTQGPNIFLIDAATREVSAATADAAAISGLDHIVVTTANPDRATAFYGARLGLELALDRTNEAWGSRLIFFRCGDLVVELARNLREPLSDAPDRLWGLSWRTHDIAATHARLRDAGFDVSEIRDGRKPGTRVFTVRETAMKIPTLIIEPVATTASSPRARRRAT